MLWSLIKCYEQAKENCYEECSQAPFVVYIFDIRKQFNLGKLHISSLAEKLFEKKIKMLKIKSVEQTADRADCNVWV